MYHAQGAVKRRSRISTSAGESDRIAEVVVLNKTDLAVEASLRGIEELLSMVNPGPKVIRAAVRGSVPLTEIWGNRALRLRSRGSQLGLGGRRSPRGTFPKPSNSASPAGLSIRRPFSPAKLGTSWRRFPPCPGKGYLWLAGEFHAGLVPDFGRARPCTLPQRAIGGRRFPEKNTRNKEYRRAILAQFVEPGGIASELVFIA
jgi:G3E family GTPase